MTQADHGERKKEKAALPNRRDPAPGRATLPSAPGLPLSTRDRGGGSPPPGTLSFFHPWGLGAPVRRATREPSVPPLPGFAFPGEEQVRNAGACDGDLGITKWFASLSFALGAEFAADAGPGADPRRAVRHPNPQERGRVGSGTLHRARTAAPAGIERKGGPRRETPLPDRLHLLHVAHNAPTTAPGVEEPNAPHRDRGFAPTPLSVEFSSSCDVQIDPAPMQTFPPFFPNSAPVQLLSNRR